MKRIPLEAIRLIGISPGRKTSHKNGQAVIDCGNLWQKFETGNYAEVDIYCRDKITGYTLGPMLCPDLLCPKKNGHKKNGHRSVPKSNQKNNMGTNVLRHHS